MLCLCLPHVITKRQMDVLFLMFKVKREDQRWSWSCDGYGHSHVMVMVMTMVM